MTLTNGELTAQQILLIENKISINSLTYREYKRYYEADNPTLIDAAKKKDPDNRVPCAFAGKIVDTLKGYMAKPGYISYKTEGKYIETLKEIFDKNDEELKTAELLGDGLTYGLGYELLTVDEEAKQIKQYRIEPENGIAIYDNTLDKKMIAFVHIVALESDTTEITRNYVMTVYYKDSFVRYESKEIGSWTETERKSHPFKDVPAIEYHVAVEVTPIFKKVIPQIDEHDKIISSNYANENERFANAYMLLGKKVNNTIRNANGKTDGEMIAELRMFDNLFSDGDINNVNNAVGFLTKPSRGNDVSESADRFERLIYDLAMVVNPNDDSLGVSSGIALKLKMLPMEFSAANIESYFSKGLQRRIELIGNAKEIHKAEPEQVTIMFKRNIPSDLETLAITAGNLQGILTPKTIVNLFPADIVPDAQKEVDEMASVRSLDENTSKKTNTGVQDEQQNSQDDSQEDTADNE